MPKASPETIQSDPRVARAILSAPYPLASIRTRSYILLRPINPHQHGQPVNDGPRQQVQAVTFVPNAPYFYGPTPAYGQQQALPPGPSNQGGPTGMGGWPIPIAFPTAIHPSTTLPQTQDQQAAAQQLDTALRSPMDMSDDAGTAPSRSGVAGPLHVAHEIGRLTAQPSTSGSKDPPSSLNLLTSTFQTVLPRSLLEFRQKNDALDSPPKLTSSTSFFTGVTAGGGLTTAESPTTPVGPAKRRMPMSSAKGRRYGQKERESSSDEDESGWSSDATLTQRRSPLSPRLETPATPRPIAPRPTTAISPLGALPQSTKRTNRRSSETTATPSHPLFLGQTNLSPFTYEPATRRRHPASHSSMSLLGFDSDATTIIRVPRSFAERRGKRGSGGLFWKDKGKGRMEDVQEEVNRVGQNGHPGMLPLQQLGGWSMQQGVDITVPYHAVEQVLPQPLGSPTRAFSPTPMSIDPQSANPITQTPNWPHPPEPSFAHPPQDYPAPERVLPIPTPAQPTRTQQLPFTKACHNFLLVRHRQAARKRKLLLNYHRRVRAEEEEEADRMQVDTPAIPSFPSPQQHNPVLSNAYHAESYASAHVSPHSLPTAPTAQTIQVSQQPYVPQPAQVFGTSSRLADRHEISIRNIAGIARVDESKPARKRRRDLSPESSYQPFAMQYHSPNAQLPVHSAIPDHRPTMARSMSLGQGTASYPYPTLPLQPILSPSQRHSLPSSTQAGPSTLLPSVEIRTPAQNRSNTGGTGTSAESAQQGRVRISAGQYGFFEFDQSRAEAMDRRLMEEMKLARRDAWLEDLGERRGSGGRKGKGKGRR